MLSTPKLVVAPDWQAALQARSLDSFDALWNLGGDTVKRTNSTEILRAVLPGMEGDAPAAPKVLFIKKYRLTNLNQLLSGITRGALFGRSKARREFDNLRQLRAWGLDAPAPIACGEQRRAGWLVRSLLVSEGIPDPMPLDTYIYNLQQLRRAGASPPSQPTVGRGGPTAPKSVLITCLADYTRRLHDHHFIHFDLYWRNIILSGGTLDHFQLIDAHKGRLWQPHEELRCRAQDLATLDAPAPWFFRRTERLRFLLLYLGKKQLDPDAKTLARLVLAVAEPMRERQLARVREARR